MTTLTTLEIVFLIIPVLGNALALGLRLFGKHDAAEKVDQAIPLAGRLGEKLSKEQRLVDVIHVFEAVAAGEMTPKDAAAKVLGLPAPAKDATPTMPPLGPISVVAFGLLCSSTSTSCKPQDAQTAVQVTDAVLDVAGQICDELPSDNKWLKFTCKLVDGAGSVIGNTSTDGGSAFQRPESHEIEVSVDDVDEFCRRNTCNRAP